MAGRPENGSPAARLRTACAADRLLDPTRDPIRLPGACPGVALADIADHRHALDWFTAEHAVLLGTVRRASADRFYAHTWGLAWAMTTFHQRRVLTRDWVGTHVIALDAVGQLAGQDPPAATLADLADIRRELGRAHITLGRHAEARVHLGQALQLYTDPGDLAGQAHTHRYLALLSEQEGRLQEAVDHNQRSLDVFPRRRAPGRRGPRAWRARLVPGVAPGLGPGAEPLPAGAAVAPGPRQLSRELGDRYFEADILANLGEAHHAAGDLAAAVGAWQSALGVSEEACVPRWNGPDAD
ncbi:MAG: tetratricopeptide repeat protein [Actinomycetota bacterium]